MALVFILVAVGTAMPQTPPGPTPAARPMSDGAEVPIILDAPGSLESLWERIRSPDFVLLRGDHYRELLKAGARDPAKGQPIVEAVAVRGVVDRRTAELDIEFRIACPAEGSAWIPIRLDGLVLSSALDEGRTVPLRSGAGGGWEVELQGSGTHKLRVALVSRVSAAGDERRLDLPIPLAGSTTLGISIRDDPAEIILGPGEAVVPVKDPQGAGVRVDAALRPRSRLEMRWRIATEQGRDEPALLGVQGDIAVDVTPDAVRTRTRWSVASMRGATSMLSVAVDPGEELLGIELDGRAVPIDVATAKGAGPLKIPLTEPCRPGSPPQSLVIVSRRRIVDGAEASVPIRPARIGDSSLQGGALGVSQNGSIWIEGIPVRGLQRTDPANDLPSILRSRPGTILAYRILDPAFELMLHIRPSPPRIEVRTDATMILRPGTASVEARLTFQTTPGRVFEVDFPAMADEEIERPQPDVAVASSRWKPVEGAKSGPIVSSRLLSIQLTEKARESGAFTLTLRTRRRIGLEEQTFDGRWPVPVGASSLPGRVAVIRAPGIDAKLVGASTTIGAFSIIEAPEQADWPWPIDRYSNLDPAPLWLSFEGEPKALSLDISRQETSYRSESLLSAQVGRAGISYHSSVRLEVIGGLLDEFDLLVPAGVEADWSVEGLDIASRYPVQSDPAGQSRYRIVLARKGSRMITFQLRYSTKFDAPLSASSPRVGRFTWIRPGLEAKGPVRFICDSAPGVNVEIDSSGWDERTAEGGANSPKGRRFARADGPAQMPEFRAVAEPILPLPQLVVSRAYLKTTRGSDELRTIASFRVESPGSSVTVALPEGSRWVQGRVDGVPLVEIERARPNQYRISVPGASAKGSSVISVESACSTQDAASWRSPELVGAEVQECYWMLTVPMSHAVVGTPDRWSDENRWRWTGYVLMKTPLRSEGELQRWVKGEGGAASDSADTAPNHRTNQHAYLFRKSDGLAPLAPWILPRSLLLVICSGAVAVVGLGLVLMTADRRPPVVLALAIALALAAAWDTDLTVQVLLCGVLGVLLTVVAAALQWAVNRRRKGAVGRIASPSAATGPSVPTPGTSFLAEASDESTAIRPRPPAIVDAFASPSSTPPDAAPSLSEMGVRP